MATFDISRVAYDPRKHYTSVRMQQGRVLMDDDWNENERIENEERRRSRVDIIGPYGSPDSGFRIRNLNHSDGWLDFEIEPGTMHLGGLRLEMESPETYRLQKDWLPQPTEAYSMPSPEDNNLTAGGKRYDLVYLEAWQQPVSAVEDEALYEVALGGPDTTTRIRNMRRVKIQQDIGLSDCADAWTRLQDLWQNRNLGTLNERYERVPDVQLSVSFTGTGLTDDLCSPAIGGGYLGAENQAIRVQLTGPNTFIWGFNNAAPFYRVTLQADGVVEMLTEPKDQYHWPMAGQVVEIIPWSAVLSNGQKTAAQSGHLSMVAVSYNPNTSKFSLATPIPPGFGTEWLDRADKNELSGPGEYYYMRVWDRGGYQSPQPEINFSEGETVPLGNTGLAVTIEGKDRIAEDFWVIAVRPETPNQVVPWELEQGMLPHGVRRFFAPLALIQWEIMEGKVHGKLLHDCRKTFRPLTDQECCCTFTVGDGVRSRGDFNSIEEAIRNLPDAGGKVCVLSGIHNANVHIVNRTNIHISGCGERTLVRPHPDDNLRNTPIFSIESSQKVKLDNLMLVALEGTAIQVEDRNEWQASSQEIIIHDNSIVAGVHAIRVSLQEDKQGDNEIYIHHNKIGILDTHEGDVAIFVIADDVLIERNKLMVIPSPDPDDQDDPRNDGDDTPEDFFNPCTDKKIFYEKAYPFRQKMSKTFSYIVSNVPKAKREGYKALGGIQIGGASERTQVLRNVIIGGRGNGIALGSLPTPAEESRRDDTFKNKDKNAYTSKNPIAGHFYSDASREEVTNRFNSVLYEISIKDNQIQQMGLSGIGVVAYLNSRKIGLMVRVEDLSVTCNYIVRCARQIPAEIPEEMQDEVAFGGISLTACENGIIRENRIEDNGVNHQEPVCGIFILYGERIEISDNRIINNGPRIALSQEGMRRGVRGGVVIKMSFQSLNFKNLTALNEPSIDSVPALKIHDNIVSQPLGHALFMLAFGPITVVNNQLTSLGIDKQNPFSLLAGSVMILNLGISRDLIGFLIGFGLRYFSNARLSSKEPAISSQQIQILRALQYLPSGKVLFTGNQTTLDMRSADRTVGVSSQLILSLDDICFTSNQTECVALQLPDPVTYDLVLTNTILISPTIRSNDNRFTEGLTYTHFSLLSYGLLNTAASNQATHCLLVLGSRLAVNNNLVLFNDTCQKYAALVGERVAAPNINTQEGPV